MTIESVDGSGAGQAPLMSRSFRPETLDGLAETIAACAAQGDAIYPRGGGTAFDCGGVPDRLGVVVETTGLARVVDYPAGDMTITVEAGITLAALRTTLAEFGQRLPLDAPHAEKATVGGLIACNHGGPRRYGAGRPRDMVLGVAFVTSDGELVRGGGRVVKNVAGYDFPRLLTGSLGTLGVIAELTLKVRPIPEASAIAWAAYDRIEDAASALDRLNLSRTRPMAVELLDRRALRRLARLGAAAPESDWALAVGYEDNRAAVDWQLDATRSELGGRFDAARDERAASTWSALNELTDGPESPVLLRANVRPSAVAGLARHFVESGFAVQAHAANGIVRAFDPPDPSSVSDLEAAVQAARSVAVAAAGNLVVERCRPGEHERLRVWGSPRSDWELMRRVRGALDPRGLMNPGRMFATIPR